MENDLKEFQKAYLVVQIYLKAEVSEEPQIILQEREFSEEQNFGGALENFGGAGKLMRRPPLTWHSPCGGPVWKRAGPQGTILNQALLEKKSQGTILNQALLKQK